MIATARGIALAVFAGCIFLAGCQPPNDNRTVTITQEELDLEHPKQLQKDLDATIETIKKSKTLSEDEKQRQIENYRASVESRKHGQAHQ